MVSRHMVDKQPRVGIETSETKKAQTVGGVQSVKGSLLRKETEEKEKFRF